PDDHDDSPRPAHHPPGHDRAADGGTHDRGAPAHVAAHAHDGREANRDHRRPVMFTSLAHTAVCVPDVEEAVRWYEQVLGLTVIWPPVLLEGDDIKEDMGELLPEPAAVKGAILGVGDGGAGGDRVIEVIEYPNAPG